MQLSKKNKTVQINNDYTDMSEIESLQIPLEGDITVEKIQRYVDLGNELRAEFLRDALVNFSEFVAGLFRRTHPAS